MPLVIPTVDQVSTSFRDALLALGAGEQPQTREDYDRIHGSVINPTFEARSAGVEFLSVDQQVMLVRARLSQFIDNHRDGQFRLVAESIDGVVKVTRSLIPNGSSVDWFFDFPQETDVPFGKNVTCMARGVVRS